MCLILKSSKTKPKIATKDIVCYKGVIETYEGLMTPYQIFKVEIGKTYFSEISKYSNEIEVALHSFINYKEIVKWKKTEMHLGGMENELKLVKCIIPKGATYYVGTFNFYDSYASSELKYVELVN